MKNIFLILIALFVCSCGANSNTPQATGSSENLSAWQDFSLLSKVPFSEKYERADGSISWINYNDNTISRKSGDILLEMYHFVDQQKSCSPLITGVTNLSSLPNTNGGWGRVDAFDARDIKGGWPEGYELPESIFTILCTNSGLPITTKTYAFCSEKNSKTVVICINPIKDDPEMAKQIFESFRWTE